MGKAKQSGRMVSNMTAIGTKMFSTVKALKSRKTARNTKGNSTMVRNKGTANTGGPMAACIEASGITI